MDDDVIRQIDELVEEEHRLHGQASHGEPLGEDEERRLRALEVGLDRCWDLLRQRRARRAAGLDADEAAPRPAEVVERYQQ